ncbi:Erythromycin esterase [Methylobacterium sp. 4-46]|uniref:erythromycin esterase family protein n=1 Tax=unclassified Methylobacterium TaxID=2615210 RepID=UPI000152DD9B|nr:MULTISPECIES: erythromycin esterase family protein [Methylobacterium]ACA14649.1 Erythromycin esterase [Methylobacterium sp. 4-46]WFT80402.1 erythromycin esterase family protein [Methylobacterium nodulans]
MADPAAEADLVRLLRERLVPLPPPSEPGFGALADRFAAARVVLLGEATHGTREFYEARAALTLRLVAEHGFRIVAFEADWPDAAGIDRYLRGAAETPFPDGGFARFPTWMWRNREVLALAEGLRSVNAGRPPGDQVRVRGLDVYSLGASMAAVLDYLDRVDPAAARQARERYGCLSPWHAKPERYGREVMFGAKHPCEDAVAAILRDLQEKRAAYAADDPDSYLDAAQNARIVRAAEQYYRIMYRGSVESWNIRDRHMFDTLQHLMGRHAKAVVWAHNSHIGHAGATAMGWEGEFNIGELAKTAYGEDAVLVGFATDRGTVAAAHDWDEPMEVMTVRPVREDSHEALFRAAGLPRAVLDLREPRAAALREAWAAPRRERAIGVVYRPRTELQSHYFEAVLPDQFDAVLWFEETAAVTPLDRAPPRRGESETYPSGL